MIRSIMKKLPILGMTVILGLVFILADSLVDSKPLTAAFLDPGTLLFTAVIGTVLLVCFHKEFT